MAARGVIRDHSPSRTGTTAVAHNRSAIRNNRNTEMPCRAISTTGTISTTVNQRAATIESPFFSVTANEAMAFCKVSTDEATRLNASSSASRLSQAGASLSIAKKGIGGEPISAPLITVSMAMPPTSATTRTVVIPPSSAPLPRAVASSAAHTRCQ